MKKGFIKSFAAAIAIFGGLIDCSYAGSFFKKVDSEKSAQADVSNPIEDLLKEEVPDNKKADVSGAEQGKVEEVKKPGQDVAGKIKASDQENKVEEKASDHSDGAKEGSKETVEAPEENKIEVPVSEQASVTSQTAEYTSGESGQNTEGSGATQNGQDEKAGEAEKREEGVEPSAEIAKATEVKTEEGSSLNNEEETKKEETSSEVDEHSPTEKSEDEGSKNEGSQEEESQNEGIQNEVSGSADASEIAEGESKNESSTETGEVQETVVEAPVEEQAEDNAAGSENVESETKTETEVETEAETAPSESEN